VRINEAVDQPSTEIPADFEKPKMVARRNIEVADFVVRVEHKLGRHLDDGSGREISGRLALWREWKSFCSGLTTPML